MGDLGLEDMLTGDWLIKLGDLIKAQPEASQYLGKNRGFTIPEREKTFEALKGREPEDWKVVIIGQDPYPRKESAVGIAFNDGAIQSWKDPLNPSFLNIMKSVLASENIIKGTVNVGEFRAAASKIKLVRPGKWFEETRKEGVMWINTALTFSSKDTEVLKQHTDFWRPIVTGIFSVLIESKKKLMKSDPKKAGMVFVLWGGYAQKLKKVIEEENKKTQPLLPIEFVENCHPAATGPAFHANNSFTDANQALRRIGMDEVKWIHTHDGEEEPEEEKPKKKAPKKKEEKEEKEEKPKKKAATKRKAKEIEEDDDNEKDEEDDDDEEEKKPKKKSRAKK